MKIASDAHVVMVDDNPGDIQLAQECFELSVLTNPWLAFNGGQQLIGYLGTVKANAAPMPALVLLDINMPRMSGHDVLRAVRADPYFERLPIFCVLTSSSDPNDKREAEALGASGFVVKPDSHVDYVAFFNALA